MSGFRSPKDFVDAAAAPAPEPKQSGPKPWDTANPRIKVPFTVRMNEPLHAKLAWVAERLPGTSMHSIMLDAVTEKLDALIREIESGRVR